MNYSKFIASIFVASALASSFSIVMSQPAEARPCGHTWLDRFGCTIDPTNPTDNGNVLKSQFDVYVRNGSQQTITVTATYMNYFEAGKKNGCATMEGATVDCDDTVRWNTASWDVNPGAETFIIDDAVGRTIYFSAKSEDGQYQWSKKEVDMGPDYRKFTYSFGG